MDGKLQDQPLDLTIQNRGDCSSGYPTDFSQYRRNRYKRLTSIVTERIQRSAEETIDAFSMLIDDNTLKDDGQTGQQQKHPQEPQSHERQSSHEHNQNQQNHSAATSSASTATNIYPDITTRIETGYTHDENRTHALTPMVTVTRNVADVSEDAFSMLIDDNLIQEDEGQTGQQCQQHKQEHSREQQIHENQSSHGHDQNQQHHSAATSSESTATTVSPEITTIIGTGYTHDENVVSMVTNTRRHNCFQYQNPVYDQTRRVRGTRHPGVTCPRRNIREIVSRKSRLDACAVESFKKTQGLVTCIANEKNNIEKNGSNVECSQTAPPGRYKHTYVHDDVVVARNFPRSNGNSGNVFRKCEIEFDLLGLLQSQVEEMIVDDSTWRDSESS